MDWAFVRGGLCWGMFRVGKWAFPCCRTKHWLGSRSMDWRLYKVDFIGACSKWPSGLSLAAAQRSGRGQEAWIGCVYKVDFVGACSEWASGLSLAAEQSIGWGQEAWIGRVYKVDFIAACSEWASGLSSCVEECIGWGQEHGLDVCTRWILLGHVHSGQVGFPLLLNK